MKSATTVATSSLPLHLMCDPPQTLKQDVLEKNNYIYVVRTSYNGVIVGHDFYFCHSVKLCALAAQAL